MRSINNSPLPPKTPSAGLSRREYVRTMLLAASGIALGRFVSAGDAQTSTPATELETDLDFQKMLLPLPPSAKFEMDGYFVWCGTMGRSDDGVYHLLFSRWKKELGFDAWVTHSEIAHAIGDSPTGPFKFQRVVLPERGPEFWDGHCTHNPTMIRAGNKFYLYYMGNRGDRKPTKGLNWTHRNNQRIGVAVADTPAGPWTRFDKPCIDVTPGFHDSLCCNNPTVTQCPDGSFLMMYKGVDQQKPLPFGGPVLLLIARADHPEGPFRKHPDPVLTRPGVNFAAEDPFIWYQAGKYHAIAKDNAGYYTKAGRSLALFESTDGKDWNISAHPLVTKNQVLLADGTVFKPNSLERPNLYIENGKPRVLLVASDVDARRLDSFNLQIPLGD